MFPYLTCDRENPPFCDQEATRLVKELVAEFDEDVRNQKLGHIFDLLEANPPAILIYELIQIDGLLGITGFEIPNLIVRWERLDLQ